MLKRIGFINDMVIINKTVPCVVRRININHVDFALVSLFQKLQTRQVVAFKQKVHLAAVADEQLFFFRQNRQIVFKFFVNRFFVLLKNKPVFLTVDLRRQFVQIVSKISSILIVKRFIQKGAYFFYVIEQIFSLLF